MIMNDMINYLLIKPRDKLQSKVRCRRDRPGRLESTLDFAFEIHNIFGLALKTMVKVTLDNKPKAIPVSYTHLTLPTKA